MSDLRAALREQLEELEVRRDGLERTIPLAGNYAEETRGREALKALNQEISEMAARLTTLDDRDQEAEAQHRVGMRLERLRAAIDDGAFWLRRLCTTIAIGNAAAFAAVASGFIQADERKSIARPVADALTYFSTGMVLAGAMPAFLLLLALGTQAALLGVTADERGARALDRISLLALAALGFASTYCLFQGFGHAIGGVRGLIQD